MGKILEYGNLGGPPADNDLLFMGDYSLDASNPTTKRLAISDLNKKRNVDAADGEGLKLRDDGGNYGVYIDDGGKVGVGTGINPGTVDPTYDLDLQTTGVTNFRIRSGDSHDSLIRFDQTSTSQAIMGYDHSAAVFKINNHSAFGAQNHLVINTDGNIGIGDATPSYKLDVNGSIASNGSYPVVLDASTGEIKSTGAALNINKTAGQNVTFMYFDTDGSTANPALRIQASNKRVSIGNQTSPVAKLDIKEAAGATTPVLRLQNSSSGTVRTLLQLSNGSDHHYLVWDGTTLGINNDGDALGAASINFQGSSTHGKVGINAAVGTRVLEATETSGQGIVAALQSTSSGNGSKLLFRSTTNSTSVNQSQGLGFTNTISSEIMTWFAGAFRPSGASSTHYFALNYTGSAVAGGDSIYKIDDTLANNEMYLDESGNVTFKGNVAGDAYYDKGGTTVGNYCRGRFVQTFSVPYKILAGTQTYSPLFSTPVDTTGAGSAAGFITAKFATAAPHDGRIKSVRIAARNASATDDCNVDMYIYSQAALPDETAVTTNSLTTVTSANFQNAKIEDTGTAKNTIITKGYADFTAQTDTSTYPRAKLDFNQGDYLAFMIEADSGSAEATVTLTVEFYIDDTL